MVAKSEPDHRDFSSSSPSSPLPLPCSSSSSSSIVDNIDPKSNKMAIVSERKSTLNPDAPLFIPESFRQVEDFSPEWWDLVKTSTWFRDYWLNQQQLEEYFDGTSEHDRDEIVDLLPDSFDLGIDDDEFPNMEALEELVQSSCEAEELAALDNKKPLNGLEIDDAEALMKNLSLCKSSKDNRVPKFAVEPLKYREKPVQYMSPKSSSSSPRFIHQPR